MAEPTSPDKRLMQRALQCIETHYDHYGGRVGYASNVGENNTKYVIEDLRKRVGLPPRNDLWPSGGHQ